jgi:uncharacterized protein YjbJ (UPF0337 family)
VRPGGSAKDAGSRSPRMASCRRGSSIEHARIWQWRITAADCIREAAEWHGGCLAHTGREGGRKVERNRWVSASMSGAVVEEGEIEMAGGKTDELKGRVKEAAGALTGDEELKREGQVDQTVGKIKQKADKIIDKVKEAVK